MFRAVTLSIIRRFHCTHSNVIRHTVLLTACKQDQDGTAVPSWSCLIAVCKTVWNIALMCVQWKISDVGQRNCPKHVEFHSKNKFAKLVNLVGFIIRNLVRHICLQIHFVTRPHLCGILYIGRRSELQSPFYGGQNARFTCSVHLHTAVWKLVIS
jgi:hypothetical protein